MIQTTVVNKYASQYDIYIGRGSKWGNPFVMKDNNDDERSRVCEEYRNWILYGDGRHLLKDLHELKGKCLGCFCKPKECHGDILAELANSDIAFFRN